MRLSIGARSNVSCSFVFFLVFLLWFSGAAGRAVASWFGYNFPPTSSSVKKRLIGYETLKNVELIENTVL